MVTFGKSSRAQARATLGGEFPACTLSVVQRVPISSMTHVSCALSKIPYVEFSPVRLQRQVVQIKPFAIGSAFKPYHAYGLPHQHLLYP